MINNLLNFGNLLKYSKEFSKALEEAEKVKQTQRFEVSVGAGMVKIVLNGNFECLSLDIAPSLLKPEEHRTLQDLLQAAINQANAKVKESTNEGFMDQFKKIMPQMSGEV